MNCYTHTERVGVAVCVSCGAAICSACVQKTGSGKNVCSTQCAVISGETDSAIAAIASRVTRSNKATAWFCWSLGAIFLILGGISILGDLFLAIYLLLAGVVSVGAGFWYSNIAKKSI